MLSAVVVLLSSHIAAAVVGQGDFCRQVNLLVCGTGDGASCYNPDQQGCCGNEFMYSPYQPDPARNDLTYPVSCCYDSHTDQHFTAFDCKDKSSVLITSSAENNADIGCGYLETCGANECYNPAHEQCCNDSFLYFPYQPDPSRGGLTYPVFCCPGGMANNDGVPTYYYTAFDCAEQEDLENVTAENLECEAACGGSCYNPSQYLCCGDTLHALYRSDPTRGGSTFPVMCCAGEQNGQIYTGFQCKM